MPAFALAFIILAVALPWVTAWLLLRKGDDMKLDDIPHDAYVDEAGIIRWYSNDAVPFDEKLAEWGVDFVTRARCAAARNREVSAAIRQYQEARRDLSPEQRAEEAHERRGAFGPGCEVIDLFTGERHFT